jgi:hypothetical protein
MDSLCAASLMNEQDFFADNRLSIQIIEDEFRREWTDNSLQTAALLLFLIAAMSQWLLGYYAADYYDDSPTQNGLQLGSLKAKRPEIPNKNFMDIHFTCTDSLSKLTKKIEALNAPLFFTTIQCQFFSICFCEYHKKNK